MEVYWKQQMGTVAPGLRTPRQARPCRSPPFCTRQQWFFFAIMVLGARQETHSGKKVPGVLQEREKRREGRGKKNCFNLCWKSAQQHWGTRRNHADVSQPHPTFRSSRAKRERSGLEASDGLAVPWLAGPQRAG